MNPLPSLDPTHNRLEKAAFVTLQLAAVALIMFTIYDGFRFALAPEQPDNQQAITAKAGLQSLPVQVKPEPDIQPSQQTAGAPQAHTPSS